MQQAYLVMSSLHGCGYQVRPAPCSVQQVFSSHVGVQNLVSGSRTLMAGHSASHVLHLSVSCEDEIRFTCRVRTLHIPAQQRSSLQLVSLPSHTNSRFFSSFKLLHVPFQCLHIARARDVKVSFGMANLTYARFYLV